MPVQVGKAADNFIVGPADRPTGHYNVKIDAQSQHRALARRTERKKREGANSGARLTLRGNGTRYLSAIFAGNVGT